MSRLIVTAVLLLFALGGFCGVADGMAGPLDPVGLLFLFFAFVLWRNWELIAASYAPFPLNGLWERLVRPSVDRDYDPLAGDRPRRDR